MTTTKENATRERGAGKAAELRRLTENYNGNDTRNQRLRLRAALARFPLTTIEIRRDLDCMMPGTRVWELRHRDGLNIVTEWAEQTTDAGKAHRVARYVLVTKTGGAQ